MLFWTSFPKICRLPHFFFNISLANTLWVLCFKEMGTHEEVRFWWSILLCCIMQDLRYIFFKVYSTSKGFPNGHGKCDTGPRLRKGRVSLFSISIFPLLIMWVFLNKTLDSLHGDNEIVNFLFHACASVRWVWGVFWSIKQRLRFVVFATSFSIAVDYYLY